MVDFYCIKQTYRFFHKAWLVAILLVSPSLFVMSHAADSVPIEVQMPGTQPGEASLESVSRCDNCHQSDEPVVTIAHEWRGSMMSHAGRDPIFWATVAIAEQDFDGSGDLCIRCHTMGAWVGGRSTPTDGSSLTIAMRYRSVSIATGVREILQQRPAGPGPAATSMSPVDSPVPRLLLHMSSPANQS